MSVGTGQTRRTRKLVSKFLGGIEDADKEVPFKVVKTADWEIRDAGMQTESAQYNVH